MIQKIIPYIIGGQIGIGLFHMGIGLEQWNNRGVYDARTLYIFMLGIGTWLVQKRLSAIPLNHRSASIIFQHAVFLGILTWFFYAPWGAGWEVFLVGFISTSLIIMILLMIIESQFHVTIGSRNWGIPPAFWRLGTLLALINTITIPLIFMLLHESFAMLWVFFAFSWLFLWKEGTSASDNIVPEKM